MGSFVKRSRSGTSLFTGLDAFRDSGASFANLDRLVHDHLI
jgi:hypothetical protein